MKRFLILFLSFLMVVSAVPVGTAAETATGDSSTGSIVNDVTFEDDRVVILWQSDIDTVLHVEVLKDGLPNDDDDSIDAYSTSIGHRTIASNTGGETVTSYFDFPDLPEFYLVKTWFVTAGTVSAETEWPLNTRHIREMTCFDPSSLSEADRENRYIDLSGFRLNVAGFLPTARYDSDGSLIGLGEELSGSELTPKPLRAADTGSYIFLEEGCTALNKAGTMTLAESGGRYTISNADEKALALSEGQRICFIDVSSEAASFLYLTVSGISVSGTEVTFFGSEPDGIQKRDIRIKGTVKASDSVDVQRGIDFSCVYDVTLSYDIYIPKSGKSYAQTTTRFDVKDGRISMASPEVDMKIPIHGIVIPLEIVTLTSGLFFHVDAQASGSVNFAARSIFGISVTWSNLLNVKGGLTKSEVDLDFDPVSLEGDIFIGPALGQTISVGESISVDLGWDIRGGLFIHIELHGGEGGHKAEESPSWHACQALHCFEGTKQLGITGSLFAKLGKAGITIPLIDNKKEPRYFYCTLTFSDPERGTHDKGDTPCPWRGTGLEVFVADTLGNKLKDASVQYSPVNGQLALLSETRSTDTTDSNGFAMIWPLPGDLTVSAAWTDPDTGQTLYADDELTLGTELTKIRLTISRTPLEIRFHPNTAAAVENLPETQKFYYTGSEIVLTDTLPTRRGYQFEGWSADSSQQTPDHFPGAAYKLRSSIDLYAVWTPEARKVTYHANATGTVKNMPFPNPDTTGKSDTAFTLSSAVPTVSGRRFLGWSEDPSSTEPAYKAGETCTLGVTDLDLYAVWGLLADGFYVFYDANGGTGAPPASIGSRGEPLILSDVLPSREGCICIGWAYAPDADMPDFEPGSVYGGGTTVTLYAVWQYIPVNTYIVRYEPNGGTSAPAPQFGFYGHPLKLSEKVPSRTAHSFSGWNLSGGQPGVLFEPGESVQFDDNVTLIAAWLPAYRVIFGAGSAWYRHPGGTLRFKANGDLADFEALLIDGVRVDTADYTCTEGSTIVTLKERFLMSLTEGIHTIVFVYNDGETPAVPFFTGSTLPKTGDDTPLLMMATLMLVSGLGLVLTVRQRRRYRR